MMPHCKSDAQYEFFETLHDAEPTPRLVLPFQRSAEIDVQRLSRILGITVATSRRMLEAGLIPRAYKLTKLTPWRIEYDAVVEYCNSLRVKYRISERLSAPARGRRHRDEELLPFPISDTIAMPKVCRVLECTNNTVVCLLDEGKLVGYKLFVTLPGCHWRISQRSLARYLDSLRKPIVLDSRQERYCVPHRSSLD